MMVTEVTNPERKLELAAAALAELAHKWRLRARRERRRGKRARAATWIDGARELEEMARGKGR